MIRESDVRIALVYPELLGTYGDRGNAITLQQRLRWRGANAEVVEVSADNEIPSACDIYLFGGGEDAPQILAAKGMRASRNNIIQAVDRGAVVLAVCAGFQLIGNRYIDVDGTVLEGIGLVDAETHASSPRLIQEVIVEPDIELDLPLLSGFENHSGRTTLGTGVRALGYVQVGGGNGINNVDGVWSGRIIGTYLHGPVLPRNPALADLLLQWVCGELEPLDSTLENQLRAERLRAASLKGVTAWRYRRSLTRG